MSRAPLPDAVGVVEELEDAIAWLNTVPTRAIIDNKLSLVDSMGLNDTVETFRSIVPLIQSQAARIAELEAGHDEIMCWFGEARHTFPDWKSAAECFAQISENVMAGLPPLATDEERQAHSLLSQQKETK
jgi:hypothetical protein